MNQPTTPNTVEDFLPLPEAARLTIRELQHTPVYTADQMHAYVLADRAQRPVAAVGGTLDDLSNLHTCAIEAAAEWAHKEYSHAKNIGAGGPGIENAVNKAEANFRSAIDKLAKAVAAQPEQRASPTVAGSVDTPEFRLALSCYNQGHMTERDFIAHINARFAPAEPSGEAVAWAFADGLKRLARVRDGYADSPLLIVHASPSSDGYSVPLYTHPAPSEIEAAVELPLVPAPFMHAMHTRSALISYATEAVLKDRANRKDRQ